MQPTFLPWLGYFELMDRVDHWVVLDDVEFSKQSWQQRNRLVGPDGLQWVTVPVLTKGRSTQSIHAAQIADPRAGERILRTVEMLYSKAQHRDLVDSFAMAFRAGWESGQLVDLNLSLIEWLRQQLGITTPMHRSSAMTLPDDRVERLVTLCHRVGSKKYVTPPGSLSYLTDGPAQSFAVAGIQVGVHEYIHPRYDQCHVGFEPYSAALDLVLNHGPGSKEILLAGRRPITELGDDHVVQQDR